MNKGRYDAIVGDLMADGVPENEARQHAHREEARLDKMDQDIADTIVILETAGAPRRAMMLYAMRGKTASVSGMPAMSYFDARLIAYGLRCWLHIAPDHQKRILDQFIDLPGKREERCGLEPLLLPAIGFTLLKFQFRGHQQIVDFSGLIERREFNLRESSRLILIELIDSPSLAA